MTIECPKCQTNNPDSQKFCGECATPLEAEVVHTKTLETPTEELTRGSVFAGRYEIIEELGKGGMGRVYRAEDTKIKQEIALKLIRPEIAADKNTIERFKNELKTARNIRHKNVCGMFDLGEEKNQHYITMEYVSGGDLKRFIRRSKRLDTGTAISIAKQICEGLSEAHNLGIVHRDLKPNNIMIDDHGSARIMDFGIARTVKGKGITGSGVMIGTPEYMSPEQAEAKEVDQRSDIYSLGVILYEMTTGRLPFEGDTPLALAMKHKGETAKNPNEFNPQIPDDLSGVILKCLEKEKGNRYQGVGDIRSELDKIEQGLPTTDQAVPKKKTLTSKEITVQFSLKKTFIPIFVVIAIAVIGLIILNPWSKKTSVPIPTDKPSVAILYFENNSSDASLDYLHDALPSMLITDLQQSRLVHVIGEDRIYGALGKLDLLEAEKYSTDDIIKVASEVGVSHVVYGNYVMLGNKFIINASLIDANNPEFIIPLEKDGIGEESIQASVDDLTLQIKAGLNISQEKITSDMDEEIGKITTSSTEAFKYYNQGREFFMKSDYEKSIPLMEKAIDLDPGFALAYRSLGVAYGNLGNRTKRNEYVQRAFELSDRVSERERYRIQASYYYSSEKTWDKAIVANTKLLELYPDEIFANTNLGLIYRVIEEWDKAIEMLEVLTERKEDNFLPYINLTITYEAKGLYAKARELLEDYAKNFSELAHLRRLISRTYISQGEFDLALNEANKAFSLAPTDYQNNLLIGQIYQLKGDFIEADQEFRKLADTSNETDLRNSMRSLSLLYRTEGKFRESKEQIQKGIELSKQASNALWEFEFHEDLCDIFLTSGEFGLLLKETERIWDYALEADNFRFRRRSLWFKGLAYVGMNSIEKAQETADELKEFIEKGIKRKLIRFYFHLQGGIELEKKNYSQAIEYLKKTVDSLPAQHYYSFFDSLFYDTLALAYFKEGDLENAKKNYEAIVSMTWGRLWWGNIYAKAFYMLGKIHEQQANTAKAIEHYEKFLELWKNADPGIAEVDDAKKRLAGLKEL